jgi:hypothetical protein
MKMRRTRSTATRGNPHFSVGDIDTVVEAISMPQQPQISIATVLRLDLHVLLPPSLHQYLHKEVRVVVGYRAISALDGCGA